MADIKEIKSIEDYNEFINAPETVNVLKVSANWCVPCRVLGEKIRSLTTEETKGIMLGEVNAEDEWFEDKGAELKIRGIPVLIAFKGGAEINRSSGAMTNEMLLGFLNSVK